MKFYHLRTKERIKNKKTAYAFPTYGYPSEAIDCNVCKRKWNSIKELVENNNSYPITIFQGVFTDFFSCEGSFIVGKKAKGLIDMSGMKAPTFALMQVVKKSELSKEMLSGLGDRGYDIRDFLDESPEVYALSAEVCATLHKDSNVYWVDSGDNVCSHCGYGVGYQAQDPFAPYFIELSSWKGQDIFRVKEFGWALFCTENFKGFCEKQAFTGLRFEEVESR